MKKLTYLIFPLAFSCLLQLPNVYAAEYKAQRITLVQNDTSTAVNDAAITATIKSKLLADSRTSGLKITVTTNNGVVTLSGKVSSLAEKAAAAEIAAETSDVVSVTNTLKVRK